MKNKIIFVGLIVGIYFLREILIMKAKLEVESDVRKINSEYDLSKIARERYGV